MKADRRFAFVLALDDIAPQVNGAKNVLMSRLACLPPVLPLAGSILKDKPSNLLGHNRRGGITKR
jgi:hypothetical protein